MITSRISLFVLLISAVLQPLSFADSSTSGRAPAPAPSISDEMPTSGSSSLPASGKDGAGSLPSSDIDAQVPLAAKEAADEYLLLLNKALVRLREIHAGYNSGEFTAYEFSREVHEIVSGLFPKLAQAKENLIDRSRDLYSRLPEDEYWQMIDRITGHELETVHQQLSAAISALPKPAVF